MVGAPQVWSAARFCLKRLFRIARVQGISRLFFQPLLEVLPAPANFVVQPTLGDLDVLVRFADHNYHMAIAAVIVAEQIPGADLLPTWVVDPPPWEIAKRGVGTQCGPAGAVDAPAIWPAAGGAAPPTGGSFLPRACGTPSGRRWTTPEASMRTLSPVKSSRTSNRYTLPSAMRTTPTNWTPWACRLTALSLWCTADWTGHC